MGQGAKFFLSIFFGFILALVLNSLLTSAYCTNDSVDTLCSISSIILVPVATLVLTIIIFLAIPNRD